MGGFISNKYLLSISEHIQRCFCMFRNTISSYTCIQNAVKRKAHKQNWIINFNVPSAFFGVEPLSAFKWAFSWTLGWGRLGWTCWFGIVGLLGMVLDFWLSLQTVSSAEKILFLMANCHDDEF